ncbi:MAG TPA: adenosylcobalamin-dependent ribonucleoside-diphosphate reductase, partial [Ktedonobacterales bacterium]|nr:adenosylcobalamin-dependent ribonucleoside-diphosphate reductase [Ktedonobacterales bacterium]
YTVSLPSQTLASKVMSLCSLLGFAPMISAHDEAYVVILATNAHVSELCALLDGRQPAEDNRSLAERLANGSTTVVAIERPTESVPFYDFTVENHSTYLAGVNGLTAIHNTGFSFSRLRPEGSMVASTHGVASGPVSFMKIFDGATEAVKQGGCVVPETRVATSAGLVQIGSLGPLEAEAKSWHALKAPLIACTDEGARRVEEFYHNGMAAVRRIRTSHGYGFTGTLEHRVRVIDETGAYVWRHLKDLRVGDWVALQKNTYPDSTDYRFPPIIPTQQSVRPSEELGALAGAYFGSGRMESVSLADRQYSAPELEAWVTQIGIAPTTNAQMLPDVVFRAGAAFARGFLRGLFSARGSFSASENPQLAGAQALLADVQQLLLAVGIPSHIEINPTAAESPLLSVITDAGKREFAERIGFLSPTQNALLRASLGQPDSDWEHVGAIAGQQSMRDEQFTDQVTTIEEDEALTVDLSVEDNHTYIANGFVSHNTRRGANMGILRVDHPDILRFIDCKRDGSVTNFNISVAITDEFMRAYETDEEYDLVDPHTKQVTERLRARDVMARIVDAAWATGDPGLVFLDRANRSTANPTPEIQPLEATNPCGEQFLGPYDACNLGSINLGLFVHDGEIDWNEMERVTRLTTRFLDDVIEINPYPLAEVREMVRANRRIGLGVMGWAEMLFELGLRYDSSEATALGERVMVAIREWATDESQELAKTRGAFPNWEHSIYKDGPRLRNSTRTTVAPTGSISIIADCSSGIEPIFALAFQHRVKQPDGSYRVLDFVNPYFQRAVEASDIEDKAGVLEYARQHGALHGHPAERHPALAPYVTAHEIAPEWHIAMQAAYQKGVDNSISKCLAAGTLIPTSRGLIAVEDFSDVETPDTFVNIAEEGIRTGGNRILSHYYAGEQPATRIRLDNGAELVGSTASHKVQTPDGWRKLADLRVGD